MGYTYRYTNVVLHHSTPYFNVAPLTYEMIPVLHGRNLDTVFLSEKKLVGENQCCIDSEQRVAMKRKIKLPLFEKNIFCIGV